jgi:hypothetical protein
MGDAHDELWIWADALGNSMGRLGGVWGSVVWAWVGMDMGAARAVGWGGDGGRKCVGR